MQRFGDRHGRDWNVDIDSTTLRRVKTLTGVRLLDAVEAAFVELTLKNSA